ncbi:MAG TPA: peptidase M15 [Cellvibrio sp.]|uniref:M15 family metallopeptidase n=1 Tax=Cellvibrio sp. TaxID=1965322 RepID=UPI000EBEEC57|nr:M15 family metallopeptidase [Cellvibrio sp.]HCS65023.1 peptidase M15 [Cellvibrio sp.]
MRIDEMIAAVQQELGIGVDGKAGPETWGAIYQKICKVKKSEMATVVGALEPVDARSEKIIATLLPEVQPFARALVHKANANGVTIKILSGLRTYEEQDALYAQGRTAPGNKVTNAKGGFSNHNFGIAFDIGIFEGTKYLGESPKYKAIGVLGMELGLEWGGNWKTIVDQPHFQLRPLWATNMAERDMLAELRARKESGQGVYS